jgi:hypothetical protein
MRKKEKKMSKTTILSLLFMISAISLAAVTNTWTGNVSTLWSATGNWSQGRVPISTDDVVIPTTAPNNPYITATGGYTGNCRTLVIQSGKTLRVGYATINITYDFTIHGHLYYSSENAVINVGDDIFWKSGSTELINQGFINVKGDWTFEDGCNVTIGTGNTVVFNGSANQFLYVYDSNSYFGNMTVNQTGNVVLWLQNASVYDIHVDGNLTLTNNSKLQVQTTTLTVDGILDIETGSIMYLEHAGGELINNSDFTLNGAMEIDGGDVLVHGEFDLASTGILTIDGGSFIYDEGLATMPYNIRGTFNMSDGLYQSKEWFGVDSSANINVSGGIIRTSSLNAVYAGTFLPSGGTVEIQTDISGYGNIRCSNGNYFRNLSINPIYNGGGVLQTDITVQNDIEVLTGSLWFNGFEASVNNDVNIYGGLLMNNAFDVLNVGNDINWYSGSDDGGYITAGTINVSGDWYFHNGTDAQLGIGNAVNFVGSDSQLIYNFDDNASFGNVTINKPDTMPVWLDNSSAYDIQIDGDLTLTNNSILQVQSNTLVVDGTLDIQNGSKMYLEHAGGELINNSDMDLYGEITINGGTINMNGDLDVKSTGVVNIINGDFLFDGDGIYPDIVDLRGTLNLTSGNFGGQIAYYNQSDGTANISGGSLLCDHFFGNNGTFQPTGGEVEIITSTGVQGEIECSGGNYFYNLKINTSSGKAGVLQSDAIIQNNLEVVGERLIINYGATVNNNVLLFDELTIAGNETLTIGNDIICDIGSAISSSSFSLIGLSGDWYFHDGTEAQLDFCGVRFEGTGSQLVYNFDDNVSFGNVTIDKPDTWPVWLDNSSTYDIQIDGDLTLTNNSRLQVQSNTLVVDGTLDIQNGSKMYLEDIGSQLINNSDFTLNGELHIDGGDFLAHGEFELAETGILTINSGSFLSDAQASKSYQFIKGTFNFSEGLFEITNNGLYFDSSCVENISGGTIRVGSHFIAENPGTFQPSAGNVVTINDQTNIVMAADNFFNDLTIECYVATETDIAINGDLIVNSGVFNYGLTTIDVANDVLIYGNLTSISTSTLNIGNDINWFSGSTDDITDGEINVYGDWYFNDGTDAQLGLGNTVNFSGTGGSFIYCMDADAEFGNVVCNDDIAIHGGSLYPMRIIGNLNVLSGKYCNVQNQDMIVDGEINIMNSGIMALISNGSLINNSDFTLNGELDIDGGDFLTHGEFELAETGILTIDGGSFISDIANGNAQQILGTFNMSNGLFEISDNRLRFESGGNSTITGGIIRATGFAATNLNNFLPSGGSVEIIQNSVGNSYIFCSSNNYFYNLDVMSGVGSMVTFVSTDITILNNLEIATNGDLYLYDNEVSVENDVNIYGELRMSDINDVLNVGNDILWNTGSSDFISTGTINVSGDWYFNDGTEAQLGIGNTVNFVGSENSYLYCADADACFGNLNIQKDLTSDLVEIYSGNDIRVSGTLNLNEGKLYTSQNTNLEIGTALNINNGGTLSATGSALDDALITHYGSTNYALNVESGGTIGGSYATFEYADSYGVNIKNGALINVVSPFTNCTFKNGYTGGTLMTIDNYQDIILDDVTFISNSKDALYNVTKNVDNGPIQFTDSSGNFAGPDYENDPYNRIEWVGFTAPTVTTDAITNIAETTATSGGNVTADGGSAVTARGVCWSTSNNPTLVDDFTVDGSGTGVFVSELTELEPNTLYFVRSYATNAVGTSYGNEVSFTTNAAIPPAVPQNLTIEITGTNIVLNWDIVSRSRAVTYKIYSSDDPNASFENWNFEEEVSNNTWSEAIPQSPKFYRVTAVE